VRTAYDDLQQPTGQVGLVARGVLLVLCSSLAAAKGTTADLLWLLALVPVAAVATVLQRSRVTSLLALAMESGVCGLAILATGSETSVFLPYLLAPAFWGALLFGVNGAIIPPGTAAVVLLLGRAIREDTTPLLSFTAEMTLWVLLSGFVGLVTAWVNHLARAAVQADPQGAQRAAYDLLSRLRTVARRLPGTLDPTSTAEALLQSVRAVAPFTHGAVLMRSAGSRLVPLAQMGAERPEWDLALSGESSVAEAWATQEPQVRERRLRRTDGTAPAGSSLVVPLALGLRTLGVLVLESDRARVWSAAATKVIATQAGDIALQLETGLLFDEVRTLATTEERNRVAREIHDGIAQELAVLGYSLDSLVVESRQPQAALEAPLRAVREEITRLVSELRLSLFDLRTNVDTGASLGTALGDYVRVVGTQTGLTVHLGLTESATRLPSSTEVELLRIAQEAVANVRKHARASNVWVACEVEPPIAVITVEDDGVGMREAVQPGSFGLTIMQERADRLGARLSVQPRPSGGTVVRVHLDTVAPVPLLHSGGVEGGVCRDADDGAPRR
jgi:signal transduction histidine kinase